jgi:hypothetical protein
MNNATDPRVITEMQAELIRNIADNIVDPDVIKPMEQIDWGHNAPPTRTNPASEGTPLVTETPKPDASATTAATAEKSVTTTAIDWESLRDPKSGLIINKYKTESEAIKGVSHAVEMAKSALNRAAILEQENAKLRETAVQRPIATYTPDPVPAATTAPDYGNDLDTVLNDIVKEGGTIDELNVTALKAAFLKTAEKVAETRINQALTQKDSAARAEQDEWDKVDSYMRTNHPDSINFTEEINLFVNTDPLTGDVVRTLISAGKKQQAAEIAWVSYAKAVARETAIQTQTTQQTQETVLNARNDVRKEIVDAARADAGVVATSMGGVHESPNVGNSRDEINAAAAGMQAGDANAAAIWRAMTFGKDLTGPLFD